MERIKRKYRRRIQHNAEKPGTDTSKASFLAQAIVDRNREIEQERAKLDMEPEPSSDASPFAPSNESAGLTIQVNKPPVKPKNNLPMIPENELALIKQINLLMAQLRVVQAGNRLRSDAAGELEQLNAAADQLIGARRRDVLVAQNTAQSMGK